MPRHAQAAVPELIVQLREGDSAALNALFATLYDELRLLAHRQRVRWRGNYTLDTAALLHEAYLKLAKQQQVRIESRAHFLALASKAMRHIFFSYAQERRAQKRGGRAEPVSLGSVELPADNGVGPCDNAADDLIAALEIAMRGLELANARTCAVVECRFYGGMTVDETAEALGVSPRTVKRDWSFAQAWLHRELQRVI